MSVVLGTRESSSTSTVTCQRSPSHSSPVTASGSYPVSSSTVVRAAWLSSWADSRPSSFDPAMVLLPRESTNLHQALDQRILGLGDLLLVEVARLARCLQFEQSGACRRLVVELLLGLLLDPFGDPYRSAYGSQRQRQKPGDQSHPASPAVSLASAKL